MVRGTPEVRIAKGKNGALKGRFEARGEEVDQSLLTLLIEQSPAAIVLYGNDDRLIFCNLKFRDINYLIRETTEFGVSFEDHLRAGLRAGCFPDAVGREEEWLRDRMERHLSPRGPFEVSRQNGHWFLVHEQALLNGGVVVISSDITKQKDTEMKLNRQKEAAEEAARAKSQFLALVNHELRTPLTSINGALGLITAGAIGTLPGKVKEMTEMAFRNGKRLESLVNNLLEVEKIQAGEIDCTLRRVDLSEIVKKSLDAHAGNASHRTVTFVLKTGLSGPLWIDGDEDRLLKMMDAFLSNAIKFSPDGGQIVVSLAEDADWTQVTVSDQGPGIPGDFRARMFQPFSQVDAEDTRRYGGLGLGMSVAKSIIDGHNGDIDFRSEPGQGTTFLISLPKSSENKSMAGGVEREIDPAPQNKTGMVWSRRRYRRVR